MSIAIIVPTTGRDSLQATLASLAPQVQDGDRVLVMCDEPTAYDSVQRRIDTLRDSGVQGCWRAYPSVERLGHFGHPQRNRAIELLTDLEDPPAWCWSLDDDDVATMGALDFIRSYISLTGHAAAPWYIFRMVGGPGSHFDGLTVPTSGPVIEPGNVGTPMIVFPTDCDARFGLSAFRGQPPGYFGDAEMAEELLGVLDEPRWCEETVAVIRPAAE